ncbi:hypothetical protein K1719_016517 [Acacia pycnantha]|nr:hypothetical protein K1719_016517 [Acacia pycnantha]
MRTTAEASPPTATTKTLSPSPVILTQDDLKKIAAYKAEEYVEFDMVLGLGTRSMAKHAVDRIGDLLRQGKIKHIIGIPTSRRFHWGFHCQISIHTQPWISIQSSRYSNPFLWFSSLILSNLFFFFLFSKSV